jgi:hypothetical protein
MVAGSPLQADAVARSIVSRKHQVKSIALQELLDVENDAFFAGCVCPSTGILVWPTIRNLFYRLIMSDWLYSSHPLIDTSRKPAMFDVAKVAARAALHNFTHPPRRFSVLIHATGAGLFEDNGFSRNRYTHYFSQALGGETWSIEGLFDYEWPLPREGGRLSFSLPGLAAIALFSRIAVTGAVRRIAEEVVEQATSRANRLLGWQLDDARRKWLVNCCARQVAGYPLKRKWQMRWLERVKPRLLLAEECCYGHMAVLNATARECGVAVAEYQHGMVTGGHDAYNVAPALERSETYRRTMPDYFLGYGAWWNRQFNAPTQKVVIGNPHRAALLGRQLSEKKEQGMILVLGEGIETKSYLEFCRELATLLSPESRVVFRPHPMERSRVFASTAGAGQGFHIDHEPDIYPSLARAEVVVAEVTTGLFEAVGLARRIFVWNTPKSRFGLPNHPFATFDTAQDLARLVEKDRSEGIVSGDASEEIWASDWQGRFRGFIKSVCGRGVPGKGNATPDSGHEG